MSFAGMLLQGCVPVKQLCRLSSGAGLEGAPPSSLLPSLHSSSDPFPAAAGTGYRLPPAPGLCHLWVPELQPCSGHPCARGGPCRTGWGLWGHPQEHPWCPGEEGIQRKGLFLLVWRGMCGLPSRPCSGRALWGARGAADTQQQLSQSGWPGSSWNSALQPTCPYKRVAKHSCGMPVLLLPVAPQTVPAWLGSHLGYQF